ncbi:MAG TPA: class I SAM-dependent methyltransferase [Polyangia bacterium]|nr:class I SAM-dependent methyltransferase [Polyangia bacterium]
MRPLLVAAMVILMAPHSHAKHGNPDDLAGYVAKMEDPSRDAWQKPDEVLRALALAPGQTVCDIGAGPGYFALRLARAGQHVLAVDVEPRILEVLRERIVKAGARGVTPILALPDDPLLPPASCDLILIVDTFHHFPDGAAYLARLARALEPGGRVVNIDFHKRELPVGPPPDHKVAREEFLAIAARAGFTVDAEPTFLPYQYFLILKPKR